MGADRQVLGISLIFVSWRGREVRPLVSSVSSVKGPSFRCALSSAPLTWPSHYSSCQIPLELPLLSAVIPCSPWSLPCGDDSHHSPPGLAGCWWMFSVSQLSAWKVISKSSTSLRDPCHGIWSQVHKTLRQITIWLVFLWVQPTALPEPLWQVAESPGVINNRWPWGFLSFPGWTRLTSSSHRVLLVGEF